jgi:nitroreductase
MNTRKPDYPIHPQFTERWSPRAFSNEEISDETLRTGFEAARWSPSASNSQPWRFIYSRRGTPSWELFSNFLVEANRNWASKASALVVILSKKDFKSGDKVAFSDSHSFDAGSAWMSFALEMNKLGWFTHAMAGIHHAQIKAEFKLTDGFTVQTVVAVGKLGDKKTLPDFLQTREEPNARKPVKSFVSEGSFPGDWLITE